jgi:hypothetical protein
MRLIGREGTRLDVCGRSEEISCSVVRIEDPRKGFMWKMGQSVRQ